MNNNNEKVDKSQNTICTPYRIRNEEFDADGYRGRRRCEIGAEKYY